jgi:peptidoglycan/LPS O-acetylase OafA/YrhL
LNKLNALTSLRFFAALAIVIEHSRGAFTSTAWIGNFPFDYGVSFFFVLSGFILTCVYHNKMDSPRAVALFYVARVARIWPLHIATMLLFILLLPAGAWLVGGSGPDSVRVVLANIFLVQSWVPSVRYFFSLNAVSWSISTEMFFYLMFPVLRHRWAESWHWKTLLILLVLGAILTIATARGIPDVDFSNPDAPSSSGIGYIWPFVRIIEFVLGMMAGSVYLSTNSRWTKNFAAWTAIELAAMLSVWWFKSLTNDLPSRLAGHSVSYSAWGVFVAHCGASIGFAIVVLALAFQRGIIAKALNWHPLVILGNASFALYLVHQLLLGFVYTHRAGLLVNVPDLAQCVGYWAIAFAMAFLLWHFVEEPAREAIKRASIRNWIRGAPGS